MSKEFNGLSYSFSWTPIPSQYQGWTAPEIYQDLIVQEELKRLDEIDKLVENRLTFPEVEAILNKVINNSGGQNE